MKNKMTWEEWYYKYYPRLAKLIVAAFYLAVFDAVLLLLLMVFIAMGWV